MGSVNEAHLNKKSNALTSISDLAGVAASGGGTPLREGHPDFAQALCGRAGPDALVPADDDLLFHAIRSLELGLDRSDLVVEPALLLRMLSPLETLSSVLVHLFSGDAEIAADVLAGPSHGLHAVYGLLAVGRDGLVEGLVEGVAAGRHGLCADRNADVDVSQGDGVGDVGGGLEAGGAESVQGIGTGGVRDAGGEGRGTEFVGRFAIGNLSMSR